MTTVPVKFKFPWFAPSAQTLRQKRDVKDDEGRSMVTSRGQFFKRGVQEVPVDMLDFRRDEEDELVTPNYGLPTTAKLLDAETAEQLRREQIEREREAWEATVADQQAGHRGSDVHDLQQDDDEDPEEETGSREPEAEDFAAALEKAQQEEDAPKKRGNRRKS